MTTAVNTIEHDPETGEIIESKRDRFLRVTEPRVIRALKAIEIVGKIGGSNKYAYDYGEADVEEIAVALHQQVDLLSMKLGRKPRQLKLFAFGKGNGAG
jgi:hypothetical protein